MTNRELFHATMRRGNGEKLLHMEQGFGILYQHWLEDGLPSHISDTPLGKASIDYVPDLYDYFNVAGYLECTFNQFCVPAFEEKVLEEKEGRRLFVDEKGVTLTQRTDGFVGVENAMILTYTEPDMIRLMLSDHLETSKAAAAPVIEECKPDMSYVWEDCCGSTGPFIAPNIFEEIMAPWYREWKDFLVSMGVDWIMLDTDGNPTPLVSNRHEAGVDCIQPYEVNSVDMLKLAEDYPDYVMMGGIYKHMFEPGDPAQTGRFESADIRQAIDDELERYGKANRVTRTSM